MRVLLTTVLAFVVLAGPVGPGGLQPVSAAMQAPAAQKSWAWPKIPGCLADPGVKTSGATDYASPICTVYDHLLTQGATHIELISARKMNAEMDGVLYPAFLPGTEVVSFITTEQFAAEFHGSMGLVRSSTRAVTARSGSWWTLQSEVSKEDKLLESDAIRARLALLDSPSCLAFASAVRPGVKAYFGVVAPAFDQPGGGMEFWFPPDAVIASKKTESIPGSSGCDAS